MMSIYSIVFTVIACCDILTVYLLLAVNALKEFGKLLSSVEDERDKIVRCVLLATISNFQLFVICWRLRAVHFGRKYGCTKYFICILFWSNSRLNSVFVFG